MGDFGGVVCAVIVRVWVIFGASVANFGEGKAGQPRRVGGGGVGGGILMEKKKEDGV